MNAQEVVVTGGSGFIGRRVVDELLDGLRKADDSHGDPSLLWGILGVCPRSVFVHLSIYCPRGQYILSEGTTDGRSSHLWRF
jgi:nucleoside-diphosphate-sugar epimerase